MVRPLPAGRFAPLVLLSLGWVALDDWLAALETSSRAGAATALAVGVACPFALALGAVASPAAQGLLQLRALAAPAIESSAKRDRAALGWATVLGLSLALAAALPAVVAVISAVRTPVYAAVGAVIAFAGAVLIGVVGGLSILPPMTRAIAAVEARFPALGSPSLPVVFPVVIGVLALAALAFGPLSSALPWPRLGAAVVAGLIAVAGWRLGGRSARAVALARAARWPVVVLCVGLAISAAFAPAFAPADQARRDLAQRRSIGSLLLAVSIRVVDVDGDGHASLYGGIDCAPWDAERGPHRLEVPDNGADEDCSGHDARLATLPFSTGSTSHRRDDRLRLRARPHVVLVTTDALSFAHTTLGGYSRDVTPHLAEWARSATSFERAFSTSSATCNALPSLLAGVLTTGAPGLLPPQNQGPEPGPSATTLADRLSDAGYRTVALPGTSILDRESWPALVGGFDEVDGSAFEAAGRGRRGDKVYAAPHLTERALAALDEAGRRPTFLWLHYFDHHPVYGIPPGEAPFGASEVDRYDTELRFTDRQWGALFAGIDARFDQDEVVIVFTSDHGEAFDAKHPRAHHDQSLHTAETHVPFLIRAGAGRPAVKHGLASHLDLVPTILDLVGLTPEPGLLGESLVEALSGPAEPEKTFVIGAHFQPRGAPFGSPALRSTMLRTADWLWIEDYEHDTRGLFSPGADPLGEHDLSREHPLEAEWARYVLRKRLASAGSVTP